MRKTMALLLAVLTLAACCPACADLYIWYNEPAEWDWFQGWEHDRYQALQDAGRFAVAHEACVFDHTGQYALVVVEYDGASQLTILKMTEDGQWLADACNDTVPFHQFKIKSVWWALDRAEGIKRNDDDGYYCLDDEKTYSGYFRMRLSNTNQRVTGTQRPGNEAWLCIQQDADGWYVSGINLFLFETEGGASLGETPQDQASYYSLWQQADEQKDWLFRYYVYTDRGDGLERTPDPLYTAVPDPEEMNARMRLDAFDWAALVQYLQGILPDDLPDADMMAGALDSPQAEPGITTLYYNPEGGRYYHAVPNCPVVSEKYWPLMPFPAELLSTNKYHALLPCPVCDPPERPAPSADGE